MLVRATDLRHAYGERVTLDGVSFTLSARDRVALTGRNGAGKTTLLRILSGELRADSGDLEFASGVRVAFLQQDPMFGSRTVTEVMREALGFVAALEVRLRDLERAGEAALGEWAETLEAFERAGGYSAHARAAQVLAALELDGFATREAGTLSGGERTRLALAAVLVSQPDVLVLDEPTNHLDIRMREWLERTLLDYPGALLIVSHDRALLDAVCTQTMHLSDGSLSIYPGGYTRSRLARLEARRVQLKQHREGAQEQRRLRRAGAQLGVWGTNNDTLARRAKALRTRTERQTVVEAPPRERRIVMALHGGDARAETVLRAEHLWKRYGARALLEDAGLRLRTGDRVALLAPNGAGKTTLLRLLLGEIAPDPSDPEALVRYSDGVVAVHLDQTYHGLQPNRALLAQIADRVGEGAAKALLGRSGFGASDWAKLPAHLSGGERARAGIALIGATRADVLLLDEPTNHLDVETLEVLEDALQGYPGSVLFVTHDRAFAKSVATRVLGIEGARLIEYPDGINGYERARRGGERAGVERLDPARLFEHELETPLEEKPLTLAQNVQLLEERLEEIEELFLYRTGLTERDWARLRAERALARSRLYTLYAQMHAAPLEFDAQVCFFKQDVRAASDESGAQWRFWVRGSMGCPSLEGRLVSGAIALSWLGETDAMLPWFARALTQGARTIAFERLGAARVTLPDGSSSLSHEYAAELGLLRPSAPAERTRARRRRRRKGTRGVASANSEVEPPNPESYTPAPDSEVTQRASSVRVQPSTARDAATEANGAKRKRRRRRRPRAPTVAQG
jgi:ATP-binding cassette subfamily F protein 3